MMNFEEFKNKIMKTIDVTMYIIVNKKQKPAMYTLKYGKSQCIEKFIANSLLNWRDCYEIGWRCIKVDVTIQSVSNEPNWL